MHHEGLEVLPELIEQLQIGRCVLVGHSDGGSIAIISAGGNPPPGLRGIVTLAAHVFCEEISVRSIRQARHRFLEGDLRSRLERYHGANAPCAFWGWNDVWLDPRFRAWSIEEYLPAIRVPWLVIQGQDDEYGTIAQVESIVANAGGRTETLILPDCGHAPHIDRTDGVLRGTADFVLEVIAGTTGGL
jgi:pimeloyl-ACP methyl ester carboxylesterase